MVSIRNATRVLLLGANELVDEAPLRHVQNSVIVKIRVHMRNRGNAHLGYPVKSSRCMVACKLQKRLQNAERSGEDDDLSQLIS